MHIQKQLPKRSRMGDYLHDARLRLNAQRDAARGFPALRALFQKRVGYAPDLDQPRTFNEKITWRKLYDRNPLFIQASDKLRMRDVVRDILGAEASADLFPKLYLAAAHPDELDFSALPADLALKANHASGRNAFLRAGQPVDEAKLRQICARWLRLSYGVDKHEWAYQHIPRRILAEELLTGAPGDALRDLKFNMFGDRLGFAQIDHDIFGDYRQDNVDDTWSALPFQGVYPASDVLEAEPSCFHDALAIARAIGRHFDYVRVDFMFTNNRFWLNELTFYRGSGMNPFTPPAIDLTLGEMWTLPGKA
ncbi:ATP-grasp fold amidoligase family protein [Pseudoruegeria sp. SK021]|uniref:ATP-grasp fold amidoligase family protein n=1 Tax=Pseudoruegeria sp. SK021 TaxID=1933035 RepID=UPI000A217E3D|nr:ATP-grasp fold amidoligase family protein [Pseudoruegeria sp. SK021]OSP56668.1 hypothetical protein BV911_01555 [Pseudoruegeria sp. SK021]